MPFKDKCSDYKESLHCNLIVIRNNADCNLHLFKTKSVSKNGLQYDLRGFQPWPKSRWFLLCQFKSSTRQFVLSTFYLRIEHKTSQTRLITKKITSFTVYVLQAPQANISPVLEKKYRWKVTKEKKKVFKNTFGVLGPGRGIKQLFYNM